MPRRTDLETILIIGAGPIVIGQACEFDYSGTQACKTLRAEGYRIVLINSNPATIMTDPDLADATYIEPITPEIVTRVIEREKPDALLSTMGGQTALNIASTLAENGTLAKFGVELIGASAETIQRAEDRDLFRETMFQAGLECARGRMVDNIEHARDALEETGLPAIVRPSFTLGGSGGGVAYNREEFDQIVTAGLDTSPVGTVLIEESLLGWKEYEMEVVRDKADNCIIVCSIENVDPMGIHTGDSITVAPALTLTDKEYQIMRNASITVLRKIGVETGGANVQFAIEPATGRLIIIEMNPRVSRSSALASKATGFPIAKVAARLAVGYTLDELDNDITGVTPASFEPTIDYVVTKIPRFTFEKFPGTEALLTTSMKSVGEAMAIGRNFAESLQKGLRSMETDLTGLDEPTHPDIVAAGDATAVRDAIRARLALPTPDRILLIAEAIRHGFSVEEIHAACRYDPWFIRQIQGIVDAETSVRNTGLPSTKTGFLDLKKIGFSDARLAELADCDEASVATQRAALSVHPVFKRVDTCAAEFESRTPYMYSSYEGDGTWDPECEANPTARDKVIILGGGPNRIGQGIEFDYCCVHAAYSLKEAGYETIMVNCNPETISTDYDTSDRLYFEPLTVETLRDIIRVEQTSGRVAGVIVQLGGQTPLKLAKSLSDMGVRILGTSPDAIDLAEDRGRFQALLAELNLMQPANGTADSEAEALTVAERIGFPVVIRPSYVLGGRAMEIVHSIDELKRYFGSAVQVTLDSPVLLDSYLRDAVEIDVDAVADGETVFVAGILEHIEEAGIHSGDSACSLPPYSLAPDMIAEIERQTIALAHGLHVVGLMNVQYAIQNGSVYVLEVNPRASRTVPFVAKAIGIPIAKIAARVMAGEKLADFGLQARALTHTAVKEAVFPFARFPGVDIILGPEMKSTGEVMGLDRDFARAFAKSQLASGVTLPLTGKVFLSVKDSDKAAATETARRLVEHGFSLTATRGTAAYLQSKGLDVDLVNKVVEGRPHIVDQIKNGDIDLIINTTEGARAIADSFELRRSALIARIPYYTTIAGAQAAVVAIDALQSGSLEVAPLQSYSIGSVAE